MKKEKQPVVLPTIGLISIGRLAKYLRMRPEAFYYALPENTPLIKFGENFEHALINIETFGMEQLKTTLGTFKSVFMTPPAIVEVELVEEEEETEEEEVEESEPEEEETNEVEESEPEEEEEDDSLVGDEEEVEEETVEEKLKKFPETKAFYTAKSRKKPNKGKK